MKTVIILFSLLLFYENVSAQELPKGAIQIKPDDIKWIDAPPPLPSGSKIAILEGNPKSEGLFTIRAMFPPYFKIPVHTHPKDERVTVISGVVYVGFGNPFDSTKANKFTEGSYYVNPANERHYVFTGSEGCELQITTFGPWGLTFFDEGEK